MKTLLLLLCLLINIGTIGCRSKVDSENVIREMILKAQPQNSIDPTSKDWITIYNIGDEAIPVLTEEFSTNNNLYIKIHCTWGLGKLKAKSALPELLKCVKNKKEDYFLRWYAAWAIQKIAGIDLAVPRPGPTSVVIRDFPVAETWAEHTIQNSNAVKLPFTQSEKRKIP